MTHFGGKCRLSVGHTGVFSPARDAIRHPSAIILPPRASKSPRPKVWRNPNLGRLSRAETDPSCTFGRARKLSLQYFTWRKYCLDFRSVTGREKIRLAEGLLSRAEGEISREKIRQCDRRLINRALPNYAKARLPSLEKKPNHKKTDY